MDKKYYVLPILGVEEFEKYGQFMNLGSTSVESVYGYLSKGPNRMVYLILTEGFEVIPEDSDDYNLSLLMVWSDNYNLVIKNRANYTVTWSDNYHKRLYHLTDGLLDNFLHFPGKLEYLEMLKYNVQLEDNTFVTVKDFKPLTMVSSCIQLDSGLWMSVKDLEGEHWDTTEEIFTVKELEKYCNDNLYKVNAFLTIVGGSPIKEGALYLATGVPYKKSYRGRVRPVRHQ